MKNYDDYRALTYFRQSVIQRWLPTQNAVAPCIRCRIAGADGVAIKRSKSRARYTGLQHCKRLWLCPICASHASNLRRTQLKKCVETEAGRGNQLAFITYTVRHKIDDSIEVVRGRVLGAHAAMHSGRAWVALEREFDWAGSIKTVEITYGDNGWHVHLHELAFVRDDCEMHVLHDVLRKSWCDHVSRIGGSATPNRGLLVEQADTAVRDYINKWGICPELTSGADKSSRADGMLVFQFPDVVIESPEREQWALELFGRYAIGMHGIKQFWASPSLRPYFAKEVDAPPSEDAAANILGNLTDDQWRAIKRQGLRAWALKAAESGDLTDFLKSLNI